MENRVKGLIAGVAIAALLVTGTAGAGNNDQPKQPKTMKQMVTTCALLTIGAAGLGSLLKGKNGALAGAVVGAAACATVMAFNNKADKKRIAEAEARAAETRETQQEAWTDQDQSKAARASVVGEDQTRALADNTPTICRTVETQLTANGKDADSIQQTYCRAPDGNWKPKEELGIA